MSDLLKPIPKKKFVEVRKLQQLDALEDRLEHTMSEINETKEIKKSVKKKRKRMVNYLSRKQKKNSLTFSHTHVCPKEPTLLQKAKPKGKNSKSYLVNKKLCDAAAVYKLKKRKYNKRRPPVSITHRLSKVYSDEAVRNKYFVVDWKGNGQAIPPEIVADGYHDILSDERFKEFDTELVRDSKPLVVVDKTTGRLIVAKVTKFQALSHMKGFGPDGIPMICDYMRVTSKIKPDIWRGIDHKATKPCWLYGKRKNPAGKTVGSYCFKRNVSNEVKKEMNRKAAEICRRLERATKFILRGLPETLELEAIQDKIAEYPSLAAEDSALFNELSKGGWHDEAVRSDDNDNSNASNCDGGGDASNDDDSDPEWDPAVDGDAELPGDEGVVASTAKSNSRNYASAAHVDRDFYYCQTSVVGPRDKYEIAQHFIFPTYGMYIPLRTGDVLVFDPTQMHSASHPKEEDTYLYSAYVSAKTADTSMK